MKLPLPQNPPQLFTASEIGRSTGQSRYAVRRALSGVAPSACVIRGSNEADAWTLADMPHALRDVFARGPLATWQSPIPLKELHPECIDYATKLHAAFAPTFEGRFQDESVSAAELATAGVADYRKAFGHPIGPRQWQRLLDRITTRDGGAENWSRLEIYLPDENLLRRPPEAPREGPDDFPALADEFNMWANPLKPTFAEEKAIYLAAFDWLETAIADGCTEAEAKRPLIAWLQNRAGLSTCENTMRRNFNTKLKAWRDHGPDALTDGRKKANAARRAPVLSEADEKFLVECAAMKCDGFIAPAWRQCYHQLSQEIRNRYSCFLDGTRRKDYVPNAIVAAIAPKVELAWIQHQGAGYAKLHGAFNVRNWRGLLAGDIFSTDDSTLEVYAAVTMPDGSFKAIRGQFFPWVDEKAKLIFGFMLLAKEQFNARDILAGCYDALQDIGIPRKKLRFENGIFKRSKWLGRGERVNFWSDQREIFTTRLGIELIHTQPRNPRGKIVENILRLIIKRLPRQAMFVGRHEQVTAREEVKWAIREVDSGRKHPHEVGMFTFDEWERELAQLIKEYNAEPQQDSRVFEGTMSPLQAWEKFQRDASGKVVPLAPFPRELRLMLSQPRLSTVEGNGIRTVIPGTKFPVWFDSVELSRRRYEKVFIRIDPGNLDEILVTDLRGEKPLLVPRLAEVPADATREQMRDADASTKERNKYGKIYYYSLRPDSHPGFKPVILDVEARNTLVEIETQRGVQTHQRHVATARRASETTRTNLAIETVKDFLK